MARLHVLIAAGWGFAEATVFFLVPDIWLSFVGRRDLRQGIRACGVALVGALAGGILMFHLGAQDSAATHRVLESLPGISPEMIESVQHDLAERPLRAVAQGPTLGVPYKLYAANAASAQVSLLSFIAVSIPARLLRFLAVTAGIRGLYAMASRRWTEPTCLGLLGMGWVLFYAAYFHHHGW